MKKLKFLDLSSSDLRSLDLGLTPNLERLNLPWCYNLVKIDVHGGCLKSLVYLKLSYCKGLKSLSFIEQLESLEVLDISGLNLKEFPDYITTGHSINTLLELDLSYNWEMVEVPTSIGNLHKLVSLNFHFCSKLKSLPGSICSLLQHLITLKLSFTDIEELPKELGQLACLENLYLNGLRAGHLPSSICMLKHLKTLLLENCILKKLPEDVGQLESLEILHLYNCPNLREIPNSICKLKCLKELEINKCPILENLPEELGDLTCLGLLDVGKTSIPHLPNSICKLKCLKELKLYGCTGLEKLPDELGNLTSLQLLDVRDTSITHLPQSIYLLKGLKIEGSKLKGRILDHDFIQLFFKYDSEKHPQDYQHLRTLDLRRCVIEEVPEALGQLECLEELNLSYTDVKHLPGSICMLKHLKKLFLQHCVFLEKLPDEVGQLESLEELYLSRCYSVRDIPSSICMLKQLKVLDLYHCFCLEKIPEDVGQLVSLEELYLIRCYNIREIPSSICMLKHLKVLHLEGCRRLEKLPDELGYLKCLQELDIRATGITHLLWSSSLLKNKRKVFFDEELDLRATGSSKKQKNH